MQSGVFWGYISLIEGLVSRIKAERAEPMTVIATGGVASLFEGATDSIDHFDSDLTIRGLLEIHRRNTTFRDLMKKSKDELVFLPLGGSNEIGMNFNLYGFGPAHDRKWIVVDLGVTFGDQTTPGVEIILPDPVLYRALRQGHPRHRPDPRARRPPRRRALAVAAPEGAGLRHAVHRLPAAREAA
jgi:hypothetical protein